MNQTQSLLLAGPEGNICLIPAGAGAVPCTQASHTKKVAAGAEEIMSKVADSSRFTKGRQTLPLLGSKLSPPVAPPYMVTRSHIADRVFLSLGIKLVLVRGPAGFGKTTAMLQLRHRFNQEGVPNAWLNLDEADNDTPRFLAYLEETLQPLFAGHYPTNDAQQKHPP